MEIITAEQARMISEDANIAKYKEELEEIFKLIESKAREGDNSVSLLELKYTKAIYNNKRLFQEGGYRLTHYVSTADTPPSYLISW